MTDERTDLADTYRRILGAIEAWDPVDGPEEWDDEVFDAFAREVFEFQYRRDDRFRRFCRGRGVDPGDVETYRDIPAVATEVFKHVDLGAAANPTRVFRTSGTTTEERGTHRFETLELYRASLRAGFVHFCNPGRHDWRMLVCAPGPGVLPESSLSFMLGELVDCWGDAGSEFFARPSGESGSGDLSFAFDALREALDRAAVQGVPTMVLGTAFGLAEFFWRVEDSWNLPPDSVVFETGGFKGRTEEWTKVDLYRAFEHRFGVGPDRCVGEYSMTELSSQAYTPNLVGATAREPDARPFVAPPWARIEVVDPADPTRRRKPGREGLIRWYDLANVGSVVAVQTSDRGYATEEGVVHTGRARGASLRGCSLTAEEIARGA